jgi:IS5 family transposase
MKVKRSERQSPMLERMFSDYLNPDHELLRAAKLIDWDGLHEALSSYYSPLGRSGKPIRLMVGIHILKHRYSCSDERAVEQLHENAYWQSFCGFNVFQEGQILDASSLVKFRNRLGTEGMKKVEQVLLKTWTEMGLVRTRRVSVDTTAQPKNIAYPTDADLCHRMREKIVKEVKKIRKKVTLRKTFRSFTRTSKRELLRVKKLYRKNAEARGASIKTLKKMTHRVVNQAAGIVNTLYARGHKETGRRLNQLVSLGKKVVNQTEEVLSAQIPHKRLYSLHEFDVAAIKKGKSHPACEFGAVVSLSLNDDGLILSHGEYQQNTSDPKTVGQLINGIKKNTGKRPSSVGADRGFDQSLQKQERCRRRWGVKKLSIPKKGKRPHPDSEASWFKQAQRRRVKIEPVIGHLKSDHRMGRCRYKGSTGDTANVVWATVAWNTKKITSLHKQREKTQGSKRKRLAA